MKIAILTSGSDSAGMNAVVRSVVKTGILKGYEGLVRGNTKSGEEQGLQVSVAAESNVELEVKRSLLRHEAAHPDKNLLYNLRFGDGELLRDGTCEFVGGRTLKGRYIVRVGWDDVISSWISTPISKLAL